MSIENKLELLWNGANTLQNDLQIHKMLKSYYINTCRKIAKNHVQIPKEKFATSQMCPHCGCFWNDSEYSLKLIPKQLKNSTKAKKLIDKLEQVQGTTGQVLKKKQKNRAKWLKKKITNHLAINCYQCKRKSLLKMEVPKYKTRKELVSEKVQIEKEAPVLNSGKKSEKQHQQISNKGCNSPSTLQSKSKKEKIGNKSQNITKSKNKKQANSDTTNKVISKTQKQNSLLQLAALLQKQSKDDSKNSAQKRLQSFLK
ncbi:uncharacterized protein LOC119615850 [Lucilia sericata]|uniref:uncharacterized protein LOC119615850 n=1 Tax=Lucilia sericata TaxID=13632 RepID=UPI0018A85E9E|nr:uncharacterized protein LOC119615850 [Lucilia sericata]